MKGYITIYKGREMTKSDITTLYKFDETYSGQLLDLLHITLFAHDKADNPVLVVFIYECSILRFYVSKECADKIIELYLQQ